jgi:hypothetical protein
MMSWSSWQVFPVGLTAQPDIVALLSSIDITETGTGQIQSQDGLRTS